MFNHGENNQHITRSVENVYLTYVIIPFDVCPVYFAYDKQQMNSM